MRAEWFAGRLRELREKAGWTQQELAGRAGLKLGGVRNLEQGRRLPQWDTVIALCLALGVDPSAFATEPASADRQGRGRPPKDEPTAAPAKPRRRQAKNKGQRD